jgi:TolB-like protein
MERLFQLARQRKLDRVAAGYAVVAWLVVQGASIALPAFDAAPWMMRWVIVAAIVGFPLALTIAWHIRSDGEAIPAKGRVIYRWVWPSVAALVLVALLIQLAAYWSRAPSAGTKTLASAQASIAVLPFANLSGDPAKRYFSDGIADQLITELSRRKNLRVAARTSSFSFAGGNADIKTIARALNVNAVVEGSVREDGNRVRIVAELISASDGFQIWSDSYDRDLTNILALQDDIARAVSRALSQKLTGRADEDAAPVNRPRPAIDPEAYREYLQGQYYFAQRTEAGIQRAMELFGAVTKRAPNYADGFATLGFAQATIALNFNRPNEVAGASEAIAHALKIDPKNPIALMGRSIISTVQWKWRSAADDLLTVDANGVGAPGLWHSKAVFLSYMGLTQFALPAVEKAVQSDPLSYVDRYNLALYLLIGGQKDKALKVARDGSAIQPGNLEGQELICQVEAARGNTAEARRIRAQLVSMSDNPASQRPAIACTYYLAVAENDTKTVHELAQSAAAGFPNSGVNASDIGIAYGRIGDFEDAMVWFNKAYQLREPQIFAIGSANPELKPLFADPRWKAYRDKPEFRDWEKARQEIAQRFQLGE